MLQNLTSLNKLIKEQAYHPSSKDWCHAMLWMSSTFCGGANCKC
jgi:hypothetical protein